MMVLTYLTEETRGLRLKRLAGALAEGSIDPLMVEPLARLNAISPTFVTISSCQGHRSGEPVLHWRGPEPKVHQGDRTGGVTFLCAKEFAFPDPSPLFDQDLINEFGMVQAVLPDVGAGSRARSQILQVYWSARKREAAIPAVVAFFENLREETETLTERVLAFEDWVWCTCSECRASAGSHGINTQASLEKIAASLRQGSQGKPPG